MNNENNIEKPLVDMSAGLVKSGKATPKRVYVGKLVSWIKKNKGVEIPAPPDFFLPTSFITAGKGKVSFNPNSDKVVTLTDGEEETEERITVQDRVFALCNELSLSYETLHGVIDSTLSDMGGKNPFPKKLKFSTAQVESIVEHIAHQAIASLDRVSDEHTGYYYDQADHLAEYEKAMSASPASSGSSSSSNSELDEITAF